MKFLFINSVTRLSIVLSLSACLASPSEQIVVTPTEITKTEESFNPIENAAVSPTNISKPSLIYSTSPDNRYSIELDLSETPITLIILNNRSKQKAEIPLTHRHYNKIVGDGSIGLKWSTDNKILMFVLYREPFSDKREEDFSCFFAINVEQAKPITINYSSLFRGLWYQDTSDIANLEHGGLNDIYDFYFSGTNCYKDILVSECVSSYISPSGNWEFSQWEEGSNATLINLAGDVWKYSYPDSLVDSDYYFVTFVQRWAGDEKYVLFSPARGYWTSKVYGLFQMDLSNGKVISLLENNAIDQPYYLSVSPTATKVFYVTSDGKAFIKDLSKKSKISFNIDLNDKSIATFTWSPNEAMVVYSRLKIDQSFDVISADYFRLDTTNGDMINLFSNEHEYLSIIKITNSEVSIGQETYSLIDGSLIK